MKLVYSLLFLFVPYLLNAQDGKSCANAIEANAGSNTANCSLGYQWFKYTATRNGKIEISNCGYTSNYTNVEIYSSCDGSLIKCDNYCGSEQSKVKFSSTAGETYYIKWYNYDYESFIWTLTEADISPGELCNTALDANVGKNIADCSEGYQWFKFTANRDVKIIISNKDKTTDFTQLFVYLSCNGNLLASDNGGGLGQNEVEFIARSGQTYYIKWYDENTGKFYWMLNEEEIFPGEYCSLAIEAKAGTNFTNGTANYTWFKYTATRDGKILITNLGNTSDFKCLSVYTSCHDNSIIWDNTSIDNKCLVQFPSKKGQTYYIEWYSENNDTFSWLLNDTTIFPSDFCDVAIEAVADTNTADCSATGYQWFKYTATRSGKIIISNCGLTSDYTYLSIYSSCDEKSATSNNYYCGSGQEKAQVIANAGDTLYIKWTDFNYGNFKWILKEEEWFPGEICSTAIEAVNGTNTANCSNINQWFKYTATRNSKISIARTGDVSLFNFIVFIYDSCNGNLISCNNCYYNGLNRVVFAGHEGQTYYIQWSNYDKETFDWTINELDWQPGDSCEIAIEAKLGTNTANCEINDQWFKYTATHDGKIVISNCGNTTDQTGFEVFASCNGRWLILSNPCGFGQSENYLNVQKNQTYYIHWFDVDNVAFNWTISLLSPPLALNATDISKTEFKAIWSSVENCERYLLDVSTNKSFSKFVNGYEGKLIFGDTSCIVTGLNPNTKYYYRVRSYIAGTESENSNIIEVTTLSTDITTGTISNIHISPNPTNGSCYINLSEPKKIEIQVLDITGKLLQKHLINNTVNYQINFNKKGLYLIKIIDNEKVSNFKVIVQ